MWQQNKQSSQPYSCALIQAKSVKRSAKIRRSRPAASILNVSCSVRPIPWRYRLQCEPQCQCYSPTAEFEFCCFTSTETVRTIRAQDGHLHFHTAPELWQSDALSPGHYIKFPAARLGRNEIMTSYMTPSLPLSLRGTNYPLYGLTWTVRKWWSLLLENLKCLRRPMVQPVSFIVKGTVGESVFPVRETQSWFQL